MTAVRLGIVGANPEAGWAGRAHLPALRALPQFSVAAVATTRADSAAKAATAFGARHAFTAPGELAACPDVDMVVVSVRAPNHYEICCEALSRGKHLFCEWPVGSNLAQAQDIAARADAAGVRAFACLQARAAPPANHARDLLADGYIGRLLSASVYAAFSYWGEPVQSGYSASADNGANVLTIPGGHGLDLMTWLLGGVEDTVGLLAQSREQAFAADIGKMVSLTSPEQFAAMGHFKSGAVFTAHMIGAAPRGEIYQLRMIGDAGELTIEGDGMPEIAPLRLQGSRGRTAQAPIPTPDEYASAVADVAPGPALNVAYLYHQIACDLVTGAETAPSFTSALKTRELIDAIQRSSSGGTRIDL
jgi:predicted dehydrogenase